MGWGALSISKGRGCNQCGMSPSDLLNQRFQQCGQKSVWRLRRPKSAPSKYGPRQGCVRSRAPTDSGTVMAARAQLLGRAPQPRRANTPADITTEALCARRSLEMPEHLALGIRPIRCLFCSPHRFGPTSTPTLQAPMRSCRHQHTHGKPHRCARLRISCSPSTPLAIRQTQPEQGQSPTVRLRDSAPANFRGGSAVLHLGPMLRVASSTAQLAPRWYCGRDGG